MKKLTLLILFFSLQFTAQENEYTLGMLMDQNKYESIELTAPLTTRSLDNLPSNYSLKAYAPTPKSQGRQPSCVGWASGYGARTISFAIKNKWKNNIYKINQNTFSPAFVYNMIKGKTDYACKQGSYVGDAMQLIKNSGILKLSDFQYTQTSCGAKPSESLLKIASKNKIESYIRLARWDNPSNLALKVKKAISNNNPVVIGMRISSTFYKAKGTWSGLQSGSIGGHAMVVVGYDDYKDGGAFEILNSWGTKWGNNGYIWVKYNDFEKYTKTAYVMVDKIEKPEPKTIALKGSMRFQLSNGTTMPATLSPDATRNFSIVAATKSTYKLTNSYSSGTQFRLFFNSAKAAYVYLIGYGSSDKSISPIYPFDNYSAYFGYTKSEVAIPSEDYFIEMDQNPGRDILCILYSTKKIDINAVVSKLKQTNGDFTTKVKTILKPYIYEGKDITFENNLIAFTAKSTNSNAAIVPLFIEVNHK
ncbi:protein of unknown function [Lutibacter oricola]|uniref:Peptidase C1A papain C-terminal domain-containing protein n=1 Tax=Lutibacter oricola TaxID=762486 RepID=A0A1H2X5K5_9FLAO|nr:C1 family peptidase [Lutibacter oricola]SDW87549.1 protein of unknown function [Lutibacter oricola]